MRKKVHSALKDAYRYDAYHNSTFTAVIPRKHIYHYGKDSSIKGYAADTAELNLYNAFQKGYNIAHKEFRSISLCESERIIAQ